MRTRDIWTLVSVAFAWGFNFVVIKWSLLQLPPLFLTAIRFTVCAVPILFGMPRPQISLRTFFTIGLSLGLGVFGLLYLGIYNGLNPGIASVVMQSQVFFTILLSSMVIGEKLLSQNLIAIVIGGIGLAVISIPGIGTSTGLGFALTISGAACWAIANVTIKRTGNLKMVNLLVWISLIPPLPLFLLSYMFEADAVATSSIDLPGIAAVLYTSWISTLACYAVWGAQLQRYPVSAVAPFALLIPVAGLVCSALFLGQAPDLYQSFGVMLVLLALAWNAGFLSKLRFNPIRRINK